MNVAENRYKGGLVVVCIVQVGVGHSASRPMKASPRRRETVSRIASKSRVSQSMLAPCSDPN